MSVPQVALQRSARREEGWEAPGDTDGESLAHACGRSAARQPYLYPDLDVPDTVMGRFEMLSATLILYFRRTRASARPGQEIAQ